MSQTVPLMQSASVTLDSNGNGQVTLGPSIPGIIWYPVGASCIVSSDNSTPVFQVFQDAIGQSNFQGGSQTGNNDTASLSAITLYPGQTLIGVWTGGDPGATASFNLTGTMQIPGN